MSPENAQALIDCWKADATVARLSQEVLTDAVGDASIWVSQRIQPFIAERNTYANDALWDGNIKLAMAYLVKYGLRCSKRRTVSRPKTRKGLQTRIISPRLSGQHSSPQHDWHYVK